MQTHHDITFALLEAVLSEDTRALDGIDKKIFSDEKVTRGVLATMTSLLLTALVNMHGEPGTLAQIDQVRAHYAGLS